MRDPKKITIVAPGPNSEGGVRSVVERIYTRLESRADIEVTWIGSHRSGNAVQKIACFFRAVARALYHLPSSDILHVHASVKTSLLRKSVFIWLARLFGCKVIYHFHATRTVFESFFAEPNLINRYALHTLRNCDAIVVLSDIWKQVVSDVLPDSNIVVIYNPVMEFGHSFQRRHTGEMRILYLAHLIERKGYRDLLEAFAEVVKRVGNVRLVFCGSGEEQYAQDRCRALGIESAVEFHGWVSDDAKVEELAKATAFCLPSYDEGLPMGILEAMSAGVPVVATPVGGIPDVLRDDENALLFAPGDVPALGKQLCRLLEDAALRNRLSSKALRDSQSFLPDKIAKDWIGLYSDLLSDGMKERRTS
jgi:glycosyltransferase involved in cell wall biosynthesis